jgi:hypothetical protein
MIIVMNEWMQDVIKMPNSKIQHASFFAIKRIDGLYDILKDRMDGEKPTGIDELAFKTRLSRHISHIEYQ